MGRDAPGHEFGSTTQLEMRDALEAAAQAERRSGETKREVYERLILATAAHYPTLPREKVPTVARRRLQNYMWHKWGKASGRPRSDYQVANAWLWTVGVQMGFCRETTRPSAPGVFYKREENRRLGEACESLVSAIQAGQRMVQNLEEPADGEIADTFVVDADAVRRNVEDMLNPQNAVPANSQALFVEWLAAASSIDRLVRGHVDRLKAIEWAARRKRGQPLVSRKEISNIRRQRVARVPASLEPQSSTAAQWRQWHGARCPGCGCWRVDQKMPGEPLRCLACALRFPAPEPVRCPHCDHDLASVAGQRDPCPNCGGHVRLPEALK